MDGLTFDRMTRRLAAGASRRQALTALAGHPASLARLASADLSAAGAKNKKKNKNKKLGESCNKAKECESGLHCSKLFSNNVCNTKGTRCCAKDGGKCPHGDCALLQWSPLQI